MFVTNQRTGEQGKEMWASSSGTTIPSSPAAGERGTRCNQKFPSPAYWGAQSKCLGGWGRRQSPEVPRVVSEEGRLGVGYSGVSKVPYQVSKSCLLLILLYLEKNSILPLHPGQSHRAPALRTECCCLNYWCWVVPLSCQPLFCIYHFDPTIFFSLLVFNGMNYIRRFSNVDPLLDSRF